MVAALLLLSVCAITDQHLDPANSVAGVVRWLEAIQDHSSTQKKVLPSMEDNQVCTFNNALASMAFLLEGKRERAERVLNHYASRLDRKNTDPTLQSFYLNGKPRGFWQYEVLKQDGNVAAGHNPGNGDRWMGDMAWLLLAGEYYRRETGSDRYAPLTKALLDLLVSYEKTVSPGVAYIQHGWRNGDSRLHESDGHHEGNVDCEAVFRLLGQTARADRIRAWLDAQLGTRSDLPLDLYTWRAMAYGKSAKALLAIPENDNRFKKTLTIDGKSVTGFMHGPTPGIQNIWVDGTGHMACAYWAVGDRERATFYTGQLRAMLFKRTVAGVSGLALPYTANRLGGYEWVRLDRGALSAACWYLFAEHRFNPLRLEIAALKP